MRSDRAVGLVRSLRRHPESKQRSRLEAFGCSRVWSWDERELLFRYLRQGDVVAVVVAHALGPTRHDAEAMMIAIIEKHAAIYEVETELMADTPARINLYPLFSAYFLNLSFCRSRFSFCFAVEHLA